MLSFMLVGVTVARFFSNRGIEISFEGEGPHDWYKSWHERISEREFELGAKLPVSASFWVEGLSLHYESGSGHTRITVIREDHGGEIVATGQIYAPAASHGDELAAARGNRFFNVYSARISRDNPCRCEACEERRAFAPPQEW